MQIESVSPVSDLLIDMSKPLQLRTDSGSAFMAVLIPLWLPKVWYSP